MKIIRSLFRTFVSDMSTRTDEDGLRWVKSNSPGFWIAAPNVRRSMPTAHEYLNKFPEKWPWANLWLKHGQTFTSPHYRTCREIISGNELMEEGHCFRNSLILSLQLAEDGEREVRYVEGLAVDPTGIFPHAWITKGNQVFDFTWPGAWMATYFGVAFDPLWVNQISCKIGRVGILPEWDRSKKYIIEKFEEDSVARP